MRMRDTKWKKLGIARIDRLHFLLGRRRMFSCLEGGGGGGKEVYLFIRVLPDRFLLKLSSFQKNLFGQNNEYMSI